MTSTSADPAPQDVRAQDHPAGFAFGLAAYGLWGVIPLYFRQIRTIPPVEVLAHRALWSCLVLAALVVWLRRGADVHAALSRRRTALTLLGSTLFIAANWLAYIYAVATEQIVQAGLGYFITPLANVALGVALLGERLRRLQGVALASAGVGVAVLTSYAGQVPWIAVTLAVSFSLYGLLRKLAAADALVGLFIETALLAPAALAYLCFLASRADTTFAASDPRNAWLLALGGPVTTVPLLCFAAAARRLRMTTLGFLQFLAPLIQTLVAVFLFGEPFTAAHLRAYPFIAAAVVLYLADVAVETRRRRTVRFRR